MWRWLLLLIIVLIVLAATGAWWVRTELTTPYYNAETNEAFVDIPRGASSTTIAGLLAQAGVLHSKIPFVLYVRRSNLARHMQAGEYRFTSPATPVEIAERLAGGDVYCVSITVPEGLTSHETIELMVKSGLGDLKQMESMLLHTDWIRDLYPDARDLEGFLFPNTYRYSHKVSPEEIIKPMVDGFRSRFAKLVAQLPIPPGWTPAGIVTLASMIEKEVKAPEERPLVASVLVNRLRTDMPLDCDATIIFAIKLAGKYDGNLHKADLSMKSPYNTYTHKGLPPGPIANPGEPSLEAALKPAHTDYFYYVSRNDGSHQFSKDYRAHQLAVARHQKPGARSQKPAARMPTQKQ